MTDAARTTLAEEFLREAVMRSRETQAFRTAIQKSPAASDAGNCGLGERAAVVLELTERGRELYAKLWPRDASDDERARIHAAMERWIERQDALDRKRNHYLKAFRTAHGFDRTRYTPDETAEFENGLAKINREEDVERADAARELLAASRA